MKKRIIYSIALLELNLLFVIANVKLDTPPLSNQFGCLEKTDVIIFATYDEIQPELIQEHLDHCFSLFVIHQNTRKLVKWDHSRGVDEFEAAEDIANRWKIQDTIEFVEAHLQQQQQQQQQQRRDQIFRKPSSTRIPKLHQSYDSKWKKEMDHKYINYTVSDNVESQLQRDHRITSDYNPTITNRSDLNTASRQVIVIYISSPTIYSDNEINPIQRLILTASQNLEYIIVCAPCPIKKLEIPANRFVPVELQDKLWSQKPTRICSMIELIRNPDFDRSKFRRHMKISPFYEQKLACLKDKTIHINALEISLRLMEDIAWLLDNTKHLSVNIVLYDFYYYDKFWKTLAAKKKLFTDNTFKIVDGDRGYEKIYNSLQTKEKNDDIYLVEAYTGRFKYFICNEKVVAGGKSLVYYEKRRENAFSAWDKMCRDTFEKFTIKPFGTNVDDILIKDVLEISCP